MQNNFINVFFTAKNIELEGVGNNDNGILEDNNFDYILNDPINNISEISTFIIGHYNPSLRITA